MEEPKIAAAAFSLKARLASFRYAFAGVAFMLRTQHNARIHLIAALLVVATSAALQISAADWRWIVVSIVLVWAAEAFNTAIEYVCDVVSPAYSPSVRRAKDVAAGAVLLCSAGAACIGLLTFWRYLTAM